jgi:hypothetical protein
MATEKKPELVKLSGNEYGCSFGDWKAEAVKPEKLTEVEWQRRREQQFAEHVRQRHQFSARE